MRDHDEPFHNDDLEAFASFIVREAIPESDRLEIVTRLYQQALASASDTLPDPPQS